MNRGIDTSNVKERCGENFSLNNSFDQKQVKIIRKIEFVKENNLENTE